MAQRRLQQRRSQWHQRDGSGAICGIMAAGGEMTKAKRKSTSKSKKYQAIESGGKWQIGVA